jgi:glutamate carboxypeptidase
VSADALLEALRTQTSAMVDFASELVRLETPSRDPREVPRAWNLLCDALRDLSYEPRILVGDRSGGTLLARPRRPRPHRQLLLGHIDTVWPRGTLAGMPLAREGSRLCGPGIYDMKAGIAQALWALRALRDLGLAPSVEPWLLLNSDEEIGSRESRSHIEEAAQGADRALVLEPSAGQHGALKTARKGLGRYTIAVQGRAAHAGLAPEDGASAILELSHQVQALFALNDPARGVTVNVGTIQGGIGANVVAAQCRADVDVRAPSHAAADALDRAVRALRPVGEGVTLKIDGGFGRPPMERGPGEARLWSWAREHGEALGLDLEETAVGGGSDGNTTSQFCPTLDGLGPVGDGAHAHHEYIEVPALAERAALLALLLMTPPLELP